MVPSVLPGLPDTASAAVARARFLFGEGAPLVFRFAYPEQGIDDNVRKAARAEFDLAIAEVGEAGFEIHSTVRNVRRRLKRVRSILRLIRPVFSTYGAENAALRDIGAECGPIRDAMALVEAVDRLSESCSDESADPIEKLRRTLAGRATDIEAALDRQEFLGRLRASLRDARVRSELWELSHSGRKALVPGLTDAYRRARRAAQEARRHGGLESFHEWRKHVKHHLGHLSLLRGLAPEFAEGRRRQTARLARQLGDLQNLSVLKSALAASPDLLADEDRAIVEQEIDRETAGLARRSLRLGRALFAEPPAAIARRWDGYVEDWLAVARLPG